jgi:septum formation protein
MTEALTSHTIILASASPRRRQLLELIGVDFEVDPSDVDETSVAGEDPASFASRAARDKTQEVARRHPGRLVLGADTVVEVDSEILGKPSSAEDAAGMLRRLSGRSHFVHTALAVVVDDAFRGVVESAKVEFIDLTDDMIRWYVGSRRGFAAYRRRTPGAPPPGSLRSPQSGFLEQTDRVKRGKGEEEKRGRPPPLCSCAPFLLFSGGRVEFQIPNSEFLILV